jgi:flagellar hook-length control protein FliK
MQGCAMPVAISISDTANSAAQFIDGAVKGDGASRVTSQAADVNNSAASLISKDRKSNEEEFDAVLALLLNGSVLPLQQPAVQLKVEANAAESGTSDATITISETDSIAARDSNTAGDANFVDMGQLLLRRDSDAQMTSATPGMGLTSKPISNNDSTTEIVESANVPGVSLASTTATAITSPDFLTNLATVESSTASSIEAGQGRASSQAMGVVDDKEIAPTQFPANQTRESQKPSIPELPTQELPIYGVDSNVAETTIPIHVSVMAQPLESVTAKPLSSDMIQALERIGRPLDSAIDSDGLSQLQVPAAESQISLLPESGLLNVELQSEVASVPALKPTLNAVSTATTSSLESSKAQADQQLSQSSELDAQVSRLTASTSGSAEKRLQPVSAESSEVETGLTTTFELSESTTDSPALTTDSMSLESEQLQPLVAPQKRRAVPVEESLVSDDSKHNIDPASDLAAATQQSGLVSSVLPNSLPDLAASISAEMRQPLTSQVSRAIMDHVERSGVRQSDSLSVRLDPPELGEMTIELSKTHEGLAVRVTAREAVTMDMLFARGQEIESQLRGQHMNLKSLEFQRTDMSSSGFSQGQGQSQHQNSSSRRSENLLNQIRGGTRNLNAISNSHPRSVTSESNYGLSFRA